MKTLFLISIIALVITVGMSLFLYMEVSKLKEINEISYWHSKKMVDHWRNWDNWWFDNRGVSDQIYDKRLTKHLVKAHQLEREWKNDMDRLLYP